MDSIDGLVLHGGVDISSSSYNEKPINDEFLVDKKRDNYELKLIELCFKKNKPILGICRGAQILNVFLGGSLYQDVKIYLVPLF